MNKMYFHRKTAIRNAVFTRSMKVELQQVVALCAEGDIAALAVICLHRVPIINQVKR